ncbi:MAG: LysE family translocator [Kordiimonas sp.]
MSLYIAMAIFSLAMSISPGPVNFITLSTGLNQGFKAAMPFVLGATIGFTALLGVTGVGLERLIGTIPSALIVIGYAGALFIAYMGIKLATAPVKTVESSASPATFLNGAFLQWLNPKAWAACVAGIASFKLSRNPELLLQFLGIYCVICYASISLWAIAGSQLKRLVKHPIHLRNLNRLMGTGLIMLAFYLTVTQANIHMG